MSEALTQFHLIRPWWLLLMLPALGLWWLQRREADTTARWRKVIDPALLRHLLIGGDRQRWLSPENLLLARGHGVRCHRLSRRRRDRQCSC